LPLEFYGIAGSGGKDSSFGRKLALPVPQGLVLGPIAQKFAFGAYWTGWPVGEDLTDTKTLVVWPGWVIAVLALGFRGSVVGRARVSVVVAVSLMVAVYLAPRSLRGSTLDYEQLEEGVPAEDAIRTG
jgi:hypothetical protein